MKIVAFEMLVTKIFNHFISPFIEELLLRTKHNLEVYLKTLAHSILKVKQIEEDHRDQISLFNWFPLKENIFSQPRAAYKEAEVKSIIQFLGTSPYYTLYPPLAFDLPF